jgi:hypothetical protein
MREWMGRPEAYQRLPSPVRQKPRRMTVSMSFFTCPGLADLPMLRWFFSTKERKIRFLLFKKKEENKSFFLIKNKYVL